MGSRSRKRTRPAPARTPPPPPPATRIPAATPAQPGPLDEFSAIAAPAVHGEPIAATPPKRLRGEAANEAVRAQLERLAPGERPPVLRLAAVVASVMAVANIVATALGAGADSAANAGDALPFTIVSTAVLGLAAYGMWRVKYWGIMGFQVILAFQILILSVAVARVERWWFGVIIVVVVLLLCWLFWKLVRVLARVQMPARP